MCPIAQADGHDCPRLVDEAVPGKAAVIDDVVIGLEDAIGEPVVADELPDVFDRVSSGDFGGSGIKVILSGMSSLAERCQPHQGRWCFGKTPMQTFLDALPLAKEVA